MSATTSTPITGVHAIGVPVSEQDRALEFYVDALGLEKRRDYPSDQFGGRWIEVAPRDVPVAIALVPARPGLPSGVQTGIRLTTADADALHASLQARGIEVGEVLHWPGVPPMFSLRDPDGNELEVVEQP